MKLRATSRRNRKLFGSQVLVAGVPVFEVALFAGVVQIRAGLEQRIDVLLPDRLERLEGDVAQRLDLRVPEHRISLQLGADLRRRQLRWVRADAVVDVAGRRER